MDVRLRWAGNSVIEPILLFFGSMTAVVFDMLILRNVSLYHATPYELQILPHSLSSRPHIKLMARSPTLKLSSRLDSSATHARTFLPAALASVTLGVYLFEFK
jgi:hypothetical protein